MRRLLPFALALLVTTFVTTTAHAQKTPAADAPAPVSTQSGPVGDGTLVVETNLPDGMLYADGELLGAASTGVFVLPAGRYDLSLRETDLEAWKPRAATAEVLVEPETSTTIRLDVPYRYRVESFPYGAVVTLEEDGEEQRLGVTPLSVESEGPLEGTLVVERAGYTVARQTPGTAADNRYSFVLRPIDYTEATGELALRGPRDPNRWIDAAAIGLALGAGAVAVYYKFKGNDAYDEYAARGGDPSERGDFERYDTYSAIALGAMQVGIGVFAIRLVLR